MIAAFFPIVVVPLILKSGVLPRAILAGVGGVLVVGVLGRKWEFAVVARIMLAGAVFMISSLLVDQPWWA